VAGLRFKELKKHSARYDTCLHREIRENPVWTTHLVSAVKNHSHLLRCRFAQHYSQGMIKQIQISKAIRDMLVQKFTLIEAHDLYSGCSPIDYPKSSLCDPNRVKISTWILSGMKDPISRFCWHRRGQGGRKSPRNFRRLMKVGGFFVLLVPHLTHDIHYEHPKKR
jgi:hypothetical protein